MRYQFNVDTVGEGPVRIRDTVQNQDVIKLPLAVAEKTLLIYKTAAATRGEEIADEWMHGYVSGAIDTELILKGLVK